MDTMIYRGPEYGALAIIPGSGVVTTIDHGIEEQALDAALGILEQYSDVEIMGGGESAWKPRTHPAKIVLSIDGALRRAGYVEDPLAERSIIKVNEDEARAPDLPCEPFVPIQHDGTINEHVHLGIMSVVETVSAAIDPLATQVSVARRPNADGAPFVRVRMVREGGCYIVQKALREALVAFEGIIRASASTCEGHIIAEFALLPTQDMLDEFESHALPTFPERDLMYQRPVKFALAEDLCDDAVSRAIECGAAISVEVADRVANVSVPCNEVPGYEFSERVRWLCEEFGRHGGSLAQIGKVAR